MKILVVDNLIKSRKTIRNWCCKCKEGGSVCGSSSYILLDGLKYLSGVTVPFLGALSVPKDGSGYVTWLEMRLFTQTEKESFELSFSFVSMKVEL